VLVSVIDRTPEPFGKCQRPLNATEKLLKSTREFYKCFKPSHNSFTLPGASRPILKVSGTSKCY